MNQQTITRRQFLKASGVTLAAACLAGSTAGCTTQTDIQPALTVTTPTQGEKKELDMDKPILVTYATRTGSTVGVAEAVAESLAARGYTVDCKPITDNPSPAHYGAVIIGSAINGAKWLPEAVDFVKNHQSDLSRLPLALFCVHAMNLGDDDRSKRNRLAYLDNIREMVTPRAEAFFAGVGGNQAESSAFMRFICRIFKIASGDCRDWTKIRAWGESVFA